jgi:hypothetical protein
MSKYWPARKSALSNSLAIELSGLLHSAYLLVRREHATKRWASSEATERLGGDGSDQEGRSHNSGACTLHNERN